MVDWKLAYQGTRDVLAMFGAMGFALILLVIALVCAEVYLPNRMAAEPASARDELEGATELLDEAGIMLEHNELEVLGHNPGEWLPADDSTIQFWCLRAPGLVLDERWLPPERLD